MRLKNVKGANDIIIKGKYYVPNPEEYKNNWHKVFDNDNPIHIEIGMGKGDFIIESAKRYKNINFIGIEKYDSVIVRAIQKSDELEINNLRIIRMNANKLCDIFDKEVDTIYLNFSDPWPKDRHAKRRLTSPIFLGIYDNIFKDTKRIIMKTDNIDLFNYSKESIINHGYKIQYSTNDLDCLEEDNIMTEYEKKFYSQGVKINKLIAIKASKEEKSCGCIIIDNNHKVLLINQKNGNFWGFPKGHIEPNESEIETAKRETKEEVGIEVEILKDKRYETHYLKRGEIDKTTIYFLAIPKTNKIIIQESEINDAKWVKIDEAIELLSFEETKEILKTLKEDQ